MSAPKFTPPALVTLLDHEKAREVAAALNTQAARIRELEGALRGAIDHMTTCGTALRVGALSNASAVVYLCGGQGAIGAAEEARRVLGGAA